MRLLHNITYTFLLAYLVIILLGGCTDVPLHKQIAQSEGLTMEEKIQDLVYRGASRVEVVATFGEATGYTYDTLSYTVKVGYEGQITKMTYLVTDIDYPDPGYPGGYYRWVLTFDEHGALYDYQRVPIDRAKAWRIYNYLADTWTRISLWEWHSAYRNGFTALNCTDTLHCWTVGGAGLVLETSDGGKSWVSHVSGTHNYKRLPGVVPSLYSAAFPDRTNGWVTGHDSMSPIGGLILHSADDGHSWKTQLKSSKWWPQQSLWSITFSDNRQGWAVGGKGTILYTSDGGQHWLDQASGTKEPLLSIGFCDGQNGWAVGSSWTVLNTSNAGQSWHPQTIGEEQLPSKATEAEAIPRHWLTSIHPYYNVLTSVSMSDCLRGWIAGDNGTILHTEDGGTTWRAQASGTTERLNAIQFLSAQQGWAVGDRGVTLKTVNGGKDWFPLSSGTREDLRDLNFVDSDHGWVVGSYGTILHTSDGGATWIKQCVVYDCAGEAAQRFYWHPWK